jgi:hypothetical protein
MGRATELKEQGMVEFFLAGMMYLGLMFAVMFCFSFVTIGITYAVASLVRRCFSKERQPHLAIK